MHSFPSATSYHQQTKALYTFALEHVEVKQGEKWFPVKVPNQEVYMPTSLEAIHYLLNNDIVYGPGKASNAGGVATSGLEMTQNSIRLSWSFEEVDNKLKNIMESIFTSIYTTNCKYNVKSNDLLTGANIAGFEKIVDAMIKQGI